MNKISKLSLSKFCLFLISFSLILTGSFLSEAKAEVSICLVSPIGTEVYRSGDTMTISWQAEKTNRFVPGILHFITNGREPQPNIISVPFTIRMKDPIPGQHLQLVPNLICKQLPDCKPTAVEPVMEARQSVAQPQFFPVQRPVCSIFPILNPILVLTVQSL